METRQLGNTDLRVSKICLGTMTWGQQNTEVQAHEQMDFALASGINFFDTAEMYAIPPTADTQGSTESFIGSWFAKTGQRDKVILATKATGPGEHVAYIRGGPQLTRQHVFDAVEGSLSRLQTDYIDLYQIHWPARPTNFFGRLGYDHVDQDSTPLEETIGALVELIQQGKIRHYGLSNESAWGAMKVIQIADQNGWPRPVTIQNPYSLLNRSYEVGLAEVSIREQVGMLPYSPLGFGALTGKYRNGAKPEGARMTLYTRFKRYEGEAAEAAIEAYCNIAEAHGMTPATMALAFTNDRAFVTSTIIGATNMEQLKENIATASVTLSDEILKEINAVHARISNPCP